MSGDQPQPPPPPFPPQLPVHAIVLIISRGDDTLLNQLGQSARHFPHTDDGRYLGSHPADDEEAIAYLQRSRRDGAEFLLIPPASLWWLDHYRQFRRYLDEHCAPPAIYPDGARLYGLTQIPPLSPSTTLPFDRLAAELRAHALDPPRRADLDRLLAQVIRMRLATQQSGEAFDSFQRLGLHVLPVHYYSPVPDTRALPDSLWSSPAQLPGIDFNEAMQLDLMQRAFAVFHDECAALPRDLISRNEMFEGRDALVYYCMIRHFRPRRILEVGSGFSSRLAAHAALRNGDTRLTCIEPHPSAQLRAGFPGLSRLIEQPVQTVSPAEFESLEAGDILFIDSTHVCKVGSDVNYLFLDVLPRLQAGVIVHVHDIFLPREYPVQWVKHRHIFWNEQYLLRAFLMFNEQFQVLLSNVWLAMKHPDVVKQTFPTTDPLAGASFWMRRKIHAQ